MKPRIDGLLHDHIDGSAALVGIIEDLYRMAGRPFPFSSLKAWQEFFRDPYADIVRKFGTVTSVLQTAEALTLTGYAYGRHRAAEGYRYVEAKFAPQYHVLGGLKMAEAVAAMSAGLKAAEKDHGIRILPMLCIGRETDADTGVEVARIALDYDGEVALDLACDEANHPPEKHLKAFKLTYRTRVKRDCHAGEWVAREPAATYRQRLLANVQIAVYVLRCDGISHAIPLADDPFLVKYVVDNGIRVSGCPASYLYSGLIGDLRDLRLGELLDSGVVYTLNADDDLFLPPMPEVVAACDAAYDFTAAQAARIERNVRLGAFAH